MNSKHSPQFAIFLDAVQWLAAPASTQLQHYQDMLAADELALDWENAWGLVAGLLENQEISVEAYEAAVRVEREWPSETSVAFWSDESLTHNEQWKKLREKASAILKLIEH